MAAKEEQDVVFNDLLRKFDSEAVCGSRWLPRGFQASMIAAGDDGEQLHEVLGISLLLAAPSVGGLKSNFGQRVYGAAGDISDLEDPESCFSSINIPDFDVSKALDRIDACPNRFLKNDQLNVRTAQARGQPEARFCVGTCPSNAFSDDEYWLLWWVFVIPGVIAFVINASALACLASGILKRGTAEAATLLLIRLVTLAGLLGVMPVALLQNKLLCTCESDLCLSSGFWCKLNQTSIFVVMATCFTLLLKFAVLLIKLEKLTHESILGDWRVMQVAWVAPLVFAAMSFGLEENGNEQFHLAKAGVRCQFRYASMLQEFILLHIPMCLCVCGMTYFIQANMRLCSEVMLLQCKERNFTSLVKVLQKRPQLQKMLIISVVSVILMLLWLVQAIASGSVFHNYLDSIDEWYKCVRFDFARNAVVPDWPEVLASNNDGNLCPSSPTGNALFESHLLKSLFEALLPGLIASTFSWRIVHDAWVAWGKSRKLRSTGTVVPVQEVLAFDSRAYERSSLVESKEPKTGGVVNSTTSSGKSGVSSAASSASSMVHTSENAVGAGEFERADPGSLGRNLGSGGGGSVRKSGASTKTGDAAAASEIARLCKHGSQPLILPPVSQKFNFATVLETEGENSDVSLSAEAWSKAESFDIIATGGNSSTSAISEVARLCKHGSQPLVLPPDERKSHRCSFATVPEFLPVKAETQNRDNDASTVAGFEVATAVRAANLHDTPLDEIAIPRGAVDPNFHPPAAQAKNDKGAGANVEEQQAGESETRLSEIPPLPTEKIRVRTVRKSTFFGPTVTAEDF
jgi:hypothetical protein